MDLFKTHINSLIEFCIRQSMAVMLTLLVQPWLSAQQQLFFRCTGGVHFRQSAVTQQSGNCGLTLNIWQGVIKKNTKKQPPLLKSNHLNH